MRLWYLKPADYWAQGNPVGNGRLGAMLMGGTAEETIYLNEDTFWSGHPRRLTDMDTAEDFRRIQTLVKERNYHEAEDLFETKMALNWGESYLPTGMLRLHFPHGAAADYKRQLCLDKALWGSCYTADGVMYTREMLASAPHQVLAMRVTANQPGMLNFSLTADCPLRHQCITKNGDLWLMTQAPSMIEPSYINEYPEPVYYSDKPEEQGVRAWTGVRILPEGGRVITEGGRLSVEKADAAVILIATRTSFRRFNEMADIPDEEIQKKVLADLNGAPAWDVLRQAHIADYRQYATRVDFALEGNIRDDLPTDERLNQFDADAPDVGLYPLLFQFGRYLMISASRPGTQAMNLQGIWSHWVRPPWSSNYTLNINTEMNYWPAMSCALQEMAEPLVTFTKEMAESGKEVAQRMYGARGAAAHHNTDLWRFAWPVGNHVKGFTISGFWYMSLAWLCGLLYEQYEYTLDEAYLRDTAYPVMREAALFLLDLMEEEEDGTLIVCPSTSPENHFDVKGRRVVLDRTSTMTMDQTRELLGNCLKAADTLGIADDFVEEVRAAYPRLRPDTIGKDGRLMEWYDEQQERERTHRHISHLYGVHPGQVINAEETPALMEAARQAMLGRGDDGTGWSLAWKLCQWARQREGDHALDVLNMQLRLVIDTGSPEASAMGGGSYGSLLCAHPPFQIDGNFGVTAGMAELLLQSRGDTLWILPALPKKWQKGHICGLKARNRITADIAWNGEHGEATLRCDRPCTVSVSVLNDAPARKITITPDDAAIIRW